MLPGCHRLPREPTVRRATIPFWLAHLIPLLGFLTGVSRTAIVLGVVLYAVRLFFVTAGYHRYFAHRAFRLGRVTQAVFAFGGLTAAQKGPLWWASHHRAHHRYTDTERDPHSPQRGFWWSHVGWIVSDRFTATDYEGIEDFARYPELRWLNKHDWVAPWALGVASFLIGGWSGLVIGFFGSTVLLWHATFCINSVAHLFGRRRYATLDSSRNNALLAILTFGEGWHNNHHHYPRCARQGMRWWEIDVTFRVLQVLSWFRIVRDLQRPPAAVVATKQIRRGSHDLGLVRYHLSRAASVVNRAANPDQLLELLDATAKAATKLTRHEASERAPANVENGAGQQPLVI